MYYENCIAVIKGSGEKFNNLYLQTENPCENSTITEKLNSFNISDFEDSDSHWLPGLFAVFCEDSEKAINMIKKHKQRAFIDGSYLQNDLLYISFRAGDMIVDFWNDFTNICGFELIECYIDEEDEEDD